MKRKHGSGAVKLDALLYPWEKVKVYKRFTSWKHMTESGSIRYESFWNDQNPNHMKMTLHGIMQYPLEEV